MKTFCICILITAFPIKVAPKNVQNGTKKWPQVIPARSNNGFGIEAAARMPKNPTRWTKSCINSFPRVIKSKFEVDSPFS